MDTIFSDLHQQMFKLSLLNSTISNLKKYSTDLHHLSEYGFGELYNFFFFRNRFSQDFSSFSHLPESCTGTLHSARGCRSAQSSPCHCQCPRRITAQTTCVKQPQLFHSQSIYIFPWLFNQVFQDKRSARFCQIKLYQF